MKPVYILESVRTPRAKAKESGGLHDLNPFELLDSLYKFYSTNQILDPDRLDEVILGCVTQHGEQAGNIAKSSALYSKYPDHVSGLTINRFCSSSLDAINIGYLKIASGQNNMVMAGGIEMMSRVPMFRQVLSFSLQQKRVLHHTAPYLMEPVLRVQEHWQRMGNGATRHMQRLLHALVRAGIALVMVRARRLARGWLGVRTDFT